MTVLLKKLLQQFGLQSLVPHVRPSRHLVAINRATRQQDAASPIDAPR
jgi:hypothetical protein